MAIKSRENNHRSKASPSTPGIVKIAGIQMASGPNVSANLSEAERLIKIAADQGAKMVVLPEYFAIMGMKETDKVAVREQEGKGPIQTFLSKIATRISSSGGSTATVKPQLKRVLRRSSISAISFG